MESKMQDSIDGSMSEYEQYMMLKETVVDLLSHRNGRLPTLGNLRDNNESRAILGKLAALVGIDA